MLFKSKLVQFDWGKNTSQTCCKKIVKRGESLFKIFKGAKNDPLTDFKITTKGCMIRN